MGSLFFHFDLQRIPFGHVFTLFPMGARNVLIKNESWYSLVVFWFHNWSFQNKNPPHTTRFVINIFGNTEILRTVFDLLNISLLLFLHYFSPVFVTLPLILQLSFWLRCDDVSNTQTKHCMTHTVLKQNTVPLLWDLSLKFKEILILLFWNALAVQNGPTAFWIALQIFIERNLGRARHQRSKVHIPIFLD